MSSIVQKWSELKSSEQKLLMYGIFLILIVVIYFYLWVPYQKSMASLQQQTQYAQEDIAWLEDMARQIEKLKSGSSSPVGNFSGSIINTVDKSIKQNQLNKNMTLLERSGNNNVVVKFEKMNFDQLIKYLAYIKSRYGIIIKSIEIQRTDEDHFIDTRLILKKAG
ncbi:MAG: type II secretion system protein M [Gammaproteobacteria bacterium]|nr:type II secretion system protein M [Gammaproteobacteria bacterium]